MVLDTEVAEFSAVYRLVILRKVLLLKASRRLSSLTPLITSKYICLLPASSRLEKTLNKKAADSSEPSRPSTGLTKRGRPYVIVFVGVNAVGKSTSLAKVAYLLKQGPTEFMIAACDTFRAEAVKQLQSAGCAAEQGYDKEPRRI